MARIDGGFEEISYLKNIEFIQGEYLLIFDKKIQPVIAQVGFLDKNNFSFYSTISFKVNNFLVCTFTK